MARQAGIGPPADSGVWVGTTAAVFMAFVALGCGYIIVAKLWGTGQVYVTFVPVAIMVGYAMLVVLARGLRLRDDQSGDNLYYMGFLFTLTSLGVSLYQFSAARASEEIVQNFGIAIASTIAGIGLRIVFSQMRRDPVEIERVMRLELAEAARRVRRELDASVVEFGYFRRTAQQSAADSFGLMTERFDDVVAKLLASLEEMSGKLALPVDAASRQLGDATGEVSRTIGSIATALDGVAGKLNSIQTPERVIEVRLDPIAQSLAQAVERMTAQSDEQAKAVKDALAIANTASERSIDLVFALRQEYDATASANRAALEAAAAMIKSTAEALDEIKEDSKAYTESLGELLARTDETMRTFTDVLIKAGVDADIRTERLAEALPAIEVHARTLAAAAEQISGIVATLRAKQMRAERETID
jgi:LPS O-antigen subunit length determinant protein (WzzB/FepE family)